MSELQLGLLGIGILVVVGVFAYNKLQESKLKRQSEEAFGSRHDDVLLGGKAAARGGDAARRRIEPTLSPTPAEAPKASGALDTSIDLSATLETQHAAAGEAISTAIVDSAERPAKTVSWEAYNRQSAHWEPLDAAGEYQLLRAGLQLVDRKGAASEQDLSDFSAMVQGVAAAIGANCSMD